ncbi:hypothetical protein DFJ74DRAFT_654387 [Hyaloraphidium curvatum]|nr:hypothetical protein DFJ74DRAFT_654387 [Hyaloraphidium curvatum]
MTVGRNVVLRDPSPAGNGKFIRRFVTSGLVNSPGGPNAPGALSQLALNTNFTYYPGSTEVVMTLVPNMLPRDDPGADYSSLAFLTTDDFDSVSEYTFRATFRVYFDAASAAGQRRRRLYTRDTSFPASAVRQSGTADAGAISGMRIPRNASAPGAEEVIAAEPTNAPASAVGGQNVLLIAAVGVCSAALLASLCAGILACASMRRGRDRRAQGGYKELVDGANGKVAPEWPSKWGV